MPGACTPGRPGKAPLTKGGSVQTPRPGPGRPPPRAGGGRRRRGRRRRESPPPPSRAAADTASGGLQRELAPPGTGGGRRPSIRAARPVRTRGGTGEGRGLRVGKTKETDSCTSPTQGFFCLLHTRLCLQLTSLRTEEAGTPACWGRREGRLGPGSAPLSTPTQSVWREGGVEARRNEGSHRPALC